LGGIANGSAGASPSLNRLAFSQTASSSLIYLLIRISDCPAVTGQEQFGLQELLPGAKVEMDFGAILGGLCGGNH